MFRGREQFYPYDRDIMVGDLAEDGTQLRPHVVLFGEQVPNMTKAMRMINDSNVLLVIGTTLDVYPASGVVDIFIESGCPVFYIDPNPNKEYAGRVNFIAKKATEGFADFKEALAKLPQD